MEYNANVGTWLANNHGQINVDGRTIGVDRSNSGVYAGYKVSSVQVKIKLNGQECVGRLSGIVTLLGDDLRPVRIPFDKLSDSAKINEARRIEAAIESAAKKLETRKAELNTIKASIS